MFVQCLFISESLQNSAEVLEFCGKGQIRRLGSKSCSLRKTVGPSYNYLQCFDVLGWQHEDIRVV